MVLHKNEIRKLISQKRLIIRPLLEDSQIGEMSIDFRLGNDFLVSIQGRASTIEANLVNDEKNSMIPYFFQETRRRPGELFLLHPNQTVLGMSLEYVKIPDTCYLHLHMRSSYSKIGLTISNVFQPGYTGCLSIELTNSNKNPINLAVGARIFQGTLHPINSKTNYFNQKRKYLCQVRPEVSSLSQDKDLLTLKKYWEDINYLKN